MDRDKAEEESLAGRLGVLAPVAVGEPLIGEFDDGNMIVPDP